MGIRSGLFATVAALGLTTASVAADHDHTHHHGTRLKADHTQLNGQCGLTYNFMKSMDLTNCNSWAPSTGDRRTDILHGRAHLLSHGLTSKEINAAIREAIETCCDKKGKTDGICAQIHHDHH